MRFFNNINMLLGLFVSVVFNIQSQCDIAPIKKIRFNNFGEQSHQIYLTKSTKSSNVNCSNSDIIALDNSSWISVESIPSYTTKGFKIRVLSDNNTGKDRYGSVTFSLNGKTAILHIVQGAGISNPDNERFINNTISQSYDINGKIISSSKSYFDAMGRIIQNQTLDTKIDKVWVSESHYDLQGRLALSSYPAPINQSHFSYQTKFIKLNNGEEFSIEDLGGVNFTNDLVEPSAIGNFPNSLGAYYSNSNENNPQQDITERPYLRTFFDDLNPGKVLKIIGGNKIDTNNDNIVDDFPQGYSFTMQAAQELYYAFGKEELNVSKEQKEEEFKNYLGYTDTDESYSSKIYSVRVANRENCNVGETRTIIVRNASELERFKYYLIDTHGIEELIYVRKRLHDRVPLGITNSSVLKENYFFESCEDLRDIEAFRDIISSEDNLFSNLKIQKTVAIDPHGEEVVSFAYDDGRVLATARSGQGANEPERPKKRVTSLIGKQGFIDIHIPKGCEQSVNFVGGQLYEFIVYDLRTGKSLAPSLLNYPGIFRIEAVKKENLNNLAFINNKNTIQPFSSNAKGVTYDINYYDYSLNYYDDAGNLTGSLQPLGFDNEAYANYNLSGPVTHINENLKSYYKYNSLGQLLETESPDEGKAWFAYRDDGQIRFSQNEKQKEANEFSYTNYDNRARPVESGVLKEFSYANAGGYQYTFDNLSSDPAFLNHIDNSRWVPMESNLKERHLTLYDIPDTVNLQNAFGSDSRKANYANQAFVSGNVSKTYTLNPETTTTWYSYDIYGRVTWIVQKIQGLPGVKTIDYVYDDITGAVNKVYYQKGSATEQFIHRYSYNDEDYSLEKVETSINDRDYTHHADYKYYETGELRRVELAKDAQGTPLQGIDYVYNLSGALKAINHPSLSQSKDPGGDSNDVFGMQIDYYKGDYQRKGNYITSTHAGQDQYNGKIKAIRWNNAATDADTSNEKTYLYNYNRNQWLTEAQFGSSDGNATFNKHEPSVTLNTEVKNTETLTKTAQQQVVLKPGFHAKQGSTVTLSIEPSGASFTPSEDYKVDQLTYDANGNIQSLRRNQSSSNGNRAMDDLTYHYNTEKPNQLQQVTDAVTASTNAGDITSQYSTENYEYNSIGQLVRNNAEGINYTYNASGLVTEVNSRYVSVQFYYNDRNQRVRKVVSRNGQRPVTTVYVRDAAGTPMAIYRNGTLVEHTVYGASRLGVYKRQGNATYKTSYELTDHLGNVRAVVSRANTSAITGTDYYPFGMPMPLRNSLSDYRYAYQGQEKDPETGKEAFELRLWDARIGRWLSPDPYGQYHSPYLGMGNSPTSNIDSDGGWVTAVTALAGGLINAGINIYSQGGINENLDLKRVAVAFVGGAIAGATGNLQAAVVTNTAFDIADQLIANGGNYKDINYTQAVTTGALTYVGGKFIGPRLSNTKLVNGISVKLSTKAHSTRYYSPYVNNFKGGFISGFKQGANGAKINKAAFDVSSEIIGGLGAGSGSVVINKTFGGVPKIEDVFKDGFKPFDNHFFHFMNNLNHNGSGNNVEYISTELRLIGVEE